VNIIYTSPPIHCISEQNKTFLAIPYYSQQQERETKIERSYIDLF